MSSLDNLQEPLAAASKNGHTEIVAMLLHTKWIDVNQEVSIIIPTPSMSPSHLTATNPYAVFFPLQGRSNTPLVNASKNGHTETVAMLLQTKGLDVNKGVRIMIPARVHVPFSPYYH